VRRAIDGSPFKTSAGELSVSISLGAATIERWDPHTSVEFYLKQADRGLYKAKQAGRNRVAFSEAPAGQLETFHQESTQLQSA